MYRARDRLEHSDWLDRLDEAGADLDLSQSTRSTAEDLFLSHLPDTERSKPAPTPSARNPRSPRRACMRRR